MDAEHARQLIGSERERLEGLVRDRESETGIGSDSETGAISELASNDQHQGDIGTETFEREKDFSILEQIEAERLEAMPGTRTCIEHAGAH